jgi:hypothetical protein
LGFKLVEIFWHVTDLWEIHDDVMKKKVIDGLYCTTLRFSKKGKESHLILNN